VYVAGAFSLWEQWLTADGNPPPHVHDDVDEAFLVLEGSIDVWLDGQVTHLEAGGFAFGPRGIPHTYAITSQSARLLVITTPGGTEEFFRTLGEPAPTLTLPTPAAPDVPTVVGTAAAHGIATLPPPSARVEVSALARQRPSNSQLESLDARPMPRHCAPVEELPEICCDPSGVVERERVEDEQNTDPQRSVVMLNDVGRCFTSDHRQDRTASVVRRDHEHLGGLAADHPQPVETVQGADPFCQQLYVDVALPQQRRVELSDEVVVNVLRQAREPQPANLQDSSLARS
jgi:hypothetical protein